MVNHPPEIWRGCGRVEKKETDPLPSRDYGIPIIYLIYYITIYYLYFWTSIFHSYTTQITEVRIAWRLSCFFCRICNGNSVTVLEIREIPRDPQKSPEISRDPGSPLVGPWWKGAELCAEELVGYQVLSYSPKTMGRTGQLQLSQS